MSLFNFSNTIELPISQHAFSVHNTALPNLKFEASDVHMPSGRCAHPTGYSTLQAASRRTFYVLRLPGEMRFRATGTEGTGRAKRCATRPGPGAATRAFT